MKEIEIPFGAKDSELKGWEYTIPEGMEAEIKDGKIVVREKESEDERIRKEIRDFLIDMECKKEWIAHMEKQKEQKPADRFEEAREKYQVEWSEEEYGRLFDIKHYLDGTLQLSPDRRIACIDFLKSLRPSWKPSEEQMETLAYAINHYESDWGENKALRSVINELKKLM